MHECIKYNLLPVLFERRKSEFTFRTKRHVSVKATVVNWIHDPTSSLNSLTITKWRIPPDHRLESVFGTRFIWSGNVVWIIYCVPETYVHLNHYMTSSVGVQGNEQV